MDEAGIRKVVAENNSALLVEIKGLVNSSISDLKRSNESIASQQMSEIKRLKRDSVSQFNKRATMSNTKLTKLSKMPLKTPRLLSKETMSRRPNKQGPRSVLHILDPAKK